jgi:hypothetical protein
MQILRLFVVAVAIALRCVPAQAQAPNSPEALAAANELLAIISGDTIAQMTQAMTGQIWPQLQGQFQNRVDEPTLQEIRTELEKGMVRFMTEAMKDAPAVYARHFSAPELQDMAGFYRTPTGAKALRLLPQVTAEFFGTLMPRMQSFQQEIDGIIRGVLQRHGVR